MKLLEPEEESTRVEMTPMMDVTFLLLVFFIYAFLSMSVHRGVEVQLPRAEGAVTTDEHVLLVLTQEDIILLDGRTVLTAEEAVTAVALRAKTLGLPVRIRADRRAHAGPALELMAELRARGVEKVVYQVESPRE